MKHQEWKRLLLGLSAALLLTAAGCNGASGDGTRAGDGTTSGAETTSSVQESGNSGEENGGAGEAGEGNEKNQNQEDDSMDYAEIFKGVTIAKSYKGVMNNNPIIEQHYGADPFALVYDDTVYFYMTADAYEYDASGAIKENTYGKIRSLYVVSTKDMINFTDHGEITIAGAGGATSGRTIPGLPRQPGRRLTVSRSSSCTLQTIAAASAW